MWLTAVLILIFLALWALGLYDIIRHTSVPEKAIVFGRYSPAYFGFILAYAAGFVVVPAVLLLFQPQLTQAVTALQSNVLLVGLAFALLLGLGWAIFKVEVVGEYPLMRFAWLALLAVVGLSLIFAGWGQGSVRLWQQLAAGLLAVVLAVEGVIQLLAAFGRLPGPRKITSGLFIPYGRFYHNQEGLANGLANNWGWPYPNFRNEAGTRQIMLMGDTFIQALQIQPRQHLGVHLERLLNSGASPKTEVLAMGNPGFGPGLYLSDTRLRHAMLAFGPAEFVLFFHLGSDFQTVSEPTGYELCYLVDEAGRVKIHPDQHDHRHDLQHIILEGYQPVVDPWQILQTHYLTPKLLKPAPPAANGHSGGSLDIPAYQAVVRKRVQVNPTHHSIKETDLIKTPGRSNFMFEKTPGPAARQSLAVATGLLTASQEILQEFGATFRLVTIPAFPPAFFSQFSGSAWSPEIGDYDLFGPDRALEAFAEERGIAFLSLGRCMAEEKLTVAQIKALFFAEGQGHFTPQGHQFVAEAVYRHFYAPGNNAEPARQAQKSAVNSYS